MFNTSQEKLTIIIPTYNRKDRLLRTLRQLENQTDADFNIIISDNCSDYDINDIFRKLNTEFVSKIKLIRNKINLGMDLNFTLPFLNIEEGWIWQIADDDKPKVDAVSKIKRDISLYSDKAWITYPVFERTHMRFNTHEFISLSDYINFYDECSKQTAVWGDLAYIGNKIYNYKLIRDLLPDYIQYSYSRLANIVLFIKTLDSGKQGVIINDEIIEYDSSAGVQWNARNVCLGTRVFQDIDLTIENEEKKKLYRLVAPNNWLIKYTIKTYMKDNETLKYPGIGIDVLYYDLIKRYLPWHKRTKILLMVMISTNPFLYGIVRKIIIRTLK